VSGAVATVAKKRRKPGPKPSDEGPREALIAIKCRGPFKAWVERLAQADDRTVAVVIERALKLYAKQSGFTEDPPVR
jgi:hypothetical protein